VIPLDNDDEAEAKNSRMSVECVLRHCNPEDVEMDPSRLRRASAFIKKARFTQLPRALQDRIIIRTEHMI